MSRYSVELRWIVEQTLADEGLEQTEEKWSACYDVLGLSDYPIFDEAYRETLNNKIIRHYYTREIGAETVGRFRLFVRDAMHLVMPYYNQMYESELLRAGIDPLTDKGSKSRERSHGSATNEGENSASSSASAQNVYQDTPQSEMVAEQIRNLNYATNVTLDDDSSTSSGVSSSKGEYDNTVEREESGYSRPQAELLKIYRDTLVNIDRLVVEDVELSHCFMTIW